MEQLVSSFQNSGAAADGESCRRLHLQRHLPEFMLPWKILVLEALPRTPNGKIDRKALPFPDIVEEKGREMEAPLAAGTERAIAEIWQEALKLSEIRVTENFFDLGGHSLLAVRVQGMIQERLGRKLPITDLFRFPTVRSLARSLEQASVHEVEAGLDKSQERASIRKKTLASRRRLRSRRG